MRYFRNAVLQLAVLVLVGAVLTCLSLWGLTW